MSFKPLNKENAIRELVIQFFLDNDFSAQELEQIAANHESWKRFLPNLDEIKGNIITLEGDRIGRQNTEVVEVHFNSFKPNGDFDWRMQFKANRIAVNCLSYTSWENVLEVCGAYFQPLSKITRDFGKKVTGLGLNYINEFVWSGKKLNFDPLLLLKKGSSYLVPSVLNNGSLWHSHTGWYSYEGLAEPYRRLDRINVETREGPETFYCVINTHLIHDLFPKGQVSPLLLTDIFSKKTETEKILKVFNQMHNRTKEILDGLIVEPMIEELDLFKRRK